MRRSFRQSLLHCSIAACCAMHYGTASGQSLVEMVQWAQQYDAQWLSARAALDAAEYRGAQAKAGLLPSIAAQAGANRSHIRIHPEIQGLQGSAQQQSAALNASQPLYRPANRIEYEQGQRNVEITQAQLDAASQDLLVRISQAYFDVLAAQDALSSTLAQKKAVQEQLEFAKTNFEIGASTITDTREAQARYDLVIAQEIADTNDLELKRLALEQMVGKSPLQPLPLTSPSITPDLSPIQLSKWVDQAQASQPAVRQAQLALDIAELETRKAQTGHLPTVDLQASYSIQRNPDGSSTIPTKNRIHQSQIGVAVNVPIFSGFSVQNRVRETLSLEEKARADLEHAKRSAAQSARQSFYGVQSGQGQVRALQSAVLSSQAALEANQLGYQVGVRINADVLSAQSQLYQAQRDLAKARYAVLVNQLRLKQAAGTLEMQDIYTLNQLIDPFNTSKK